MLCNFENHITVCRYMKLCTVHTVEVDASPSAAYFSTDISFVVGRIPSSSRRSPRSALITELFPLLNSPTTTTRNASSSAAIASRSSRVSCISGTASSRKDKTAPITWTSLFLLQPMYRLHPPEDYFHVLWKMVQWSVIKYLNYFIRISQQNHSWASVHKLRTNKNTLLHTIGEIVHAFYCNI